MTRALPGEAVGRLSEAHEVDLWEEDRPVPREELLDRAMQIANVICERGPLAVKTAKEAILRGQDMPLEHGLAYEDVLLSRLMTTDDAKEGPKAFAEKRKPEYHGR